MLVEKEKKNENKKVKPGIKQDYISPKKQKKILLSDGELKEAESQNVFDSFFTGSKFLVLRSTSNVSTTKRKLIYDRRKEQMPIYIHSIICLYLNKYINNIVYY